MPGKAESRKRSRTPAWQRRAKQALAVGTIIFLAAFAGLFIIFLMKLRDAEAALQTPAFQDRMDAIGRQPSCIYSADGVLLYRVSAEYRLPIEKFDEVPERVRNAVIAAEDVRFYQHPGVDSQGLLRAFVSIFKDGRVSQGGSTLTMQLAKLLYNGSEKSLNRKVEDIAYAYAIEKYKTKDQILLMYLNKVYFGEGAHGIKAAAKTYFNKSLDQLTISDAAILARCIQRPSQYNPIKTPKAALDNRNLVLATMRSKDMITDDQYQQALAEVPKINPNPPQGTASRASFGQYFVEHVLATMAQDYPEIDLKTAGVSIYTSLDSHLQRHAEEVVRDVVHDNRGRLVNQGCFVAMDSEGKIRCEVGGVDFEKNQFNIVTQGLRQPGSSFKAIVYATGLATGAIFGPDDSLSNAPIHVALQSGRIWSPRNASPRENSSSYSVRTAYSQSVNLAAMHLLDKIGPKLVVSYAHDVFGVESDLYPGLPLAIGSSAVRPIEMLRAYSVFMTHGDRIEPYPITKIVGPEGESIKEFEVRKYPGVLPAGVCAIMDELMRSVVTSGTGTEALPVPNAMGKTGTTNDARDAWFCGYTDGIVGVGWVGNEQRDSKGRLVPVAMAGSVFGGTVTAKIWARIMGEMHDKYAKPVEADPGRSFAVATQSDKPDPATDESVKVKVTNEPPSQQPPDMVPDPGMEPAPTTDGGDPHNSPPDQTPPPDPGDAQRKADQAPRDAARARQDAQRAKRQDDLVQVEICADSGLRATPYCPETVTRSYHRGDAPTRFCRIHGTGR